MATRSLLSTGVPGTVAGLLKAQERFGALSRAEVMAPAIRLAEQGFAVYPVLADSLKRAAPLLQADPSAKAIYYKSGGEPYRAGEILRQPLLAATLRRIAEQGRPGFYQGPVAEQLEALMQQRGGLIDRQDLAAYRAPWVEPVQGRFRGLKVLSMPPPSSGGVTLIQMLNLLEPMDLKAMGLNSAESIHTLGGGHEPGLPRPQQ